MQFTVGTLTQCAGGNHRYIPITVGGVTRTITVDRSDAAAEPDRIEEAVLGRIRSALKEGGASLTLASWNAILSGQEYEI